MNGLPEVGFVILTLVCSPERPYDVPGGYEEAPWFYTFGDHADFSGMRIPATAVATFEKPEGPWEYFRGRVTSAN